MTRQKKLIVPTDPKAAIPKQDGSRLRPTGEVLPLTSYWTRRQRDGDVEIKDRPKRAASTLKKKEA